MLHVLATLAGGDPFLMVDLAVYVDGARHLTDGTLYDFFSEPLHLPFTYPTFSAIIFTPMTWLPWTLLRVLWQLASFGAIGLMAYCHAAAARPGRAEGAEPARSTSAASSSPSPPSGLWLEPVRTTFNYGQINLFLCALLLAGAVAGKEWMAGRVGRPRGRDQADAGHHRAVLPAAEALVRGRLVGRLLRAHRRGRRGAAAGRDVAVLHQADASTRPAPGRCGRRSTSRCAVRSPGSPARTSPRSGWSSPPLAAVLGVWATWVCLRAGDRAAGAARRAVHRAADLADLLVAPLGLGAAVAAVVPVRAAAAADRGPGAGHRLAGRHLQLRRQHPDRAAVHRPAGVPAAGGSPGSGSIYPLLGVLTLVLLAWSLRQSALGPARSDRPTPPDRDLPAAS